MENEVASTPVEKDSEDSDKKRKKKRKKIKKEADKPTKAKRRYERILWTVLLAAFLVSILLVFPKMVKNNSKTSIIKTRSN